MILSQCGCSSMHSDIPDQFHCKTSWEKVKKNWEEVEKKLKKSWEKFKKNLKKKWNFFEKILKNKSWEKFEKKLKKKLRKSGWKVGEGWKS